MRAIVVTPDAPARLAVGTAPEPVADSNQTVVSVKTLSLNRGEIKRAQSMDAGTQVGWDLAGVVAQAAADGSGPAVGARVVGFSPAMRGWAERAAVRSNALAIVPDDISLEAASTLPVAALTALYGLERCSHLVGAKVLVTGARGGVGYFACQLARAMGARVIAQVRREAHVEMIEALGVEQVVVDSQGDLLAAAGPYRLVFDGVGGPLFGRLVGCIEADGRVVTYGVSAGERTDLGLRDFFSTGTGRIEGFHLYRESEFVSAGSGLTRLMYLMQQNQLNTLISRREDWSAIGEVAQALIDRNYPGKAVLTIG